ncbi:hypothetical protein F4805DRAFT_472032 [Annulohypoxylon moriforme]|nr:hypothetical protein F4805DRAFT_472032 [Annulohypoxylon moriforme]
MSEGQTREETPEPEDLSHHSVGPSPSVGVWWDVTDQLEAIKYLKVNYILLTSDVAQERFPEFPQLHDLTWLTLLSKVKKAISVAENFFKEADSSGWLREQANYPAQRQTQQANWLSRHMRRACERATSLLEDTAALQSQILAGQHRKPLGEKRLKKPDFVPWKSRPTRHQILVRQTDHHDTTQDPIKPSDATLPEIVTQIDEAAADIERFHFDLLPDIKELEERKSLREQDDDYPPLVPTEYVPLREIEKEDAQNEWTSSVKSLARLTEEVETCRREGHPPPRLPTPELYSGILPRQESDDQGPLPSISKLFRDDEFMKTSFVDQAETRKQLPHPEVKRKFDTYIEEEGRRGVQRFLNESMEIFDRRIATHHNYHKGELEVCEYFRDQSRPYLAKDHWIGFKKAKVESVISGR